MTVQMEKIPQHLHKDVIGSYWIMLQELQSKAEENNDIMLKRWVESFYRQWNEITGDDKKARWEK